MLRVLYVADSLMAGGIESQLVELVTRLDRTRVEPHLLALYGPRARDLHFAPQIRQAQIPLHLLDLGWGAADKARAVLSLVATVWQIRPHIVQAEGYHANLLTRLARPLLPRVQLIGTIRGAETPKQMLYQRLSYRMCRVMVASGASLKQSLMMQAHIPGERVRVIPNAIDVVRFAKAKPHEPDLRQQIAPGAQRVLVSLGRISKQKTMHLIPQGIGLLKRQGRLPPHMLVFIVGAVEDASMQALLEDAIQRDELHDVVMQCPPTSMPEDFLHAADASLLFSQFEGVSISMLESLAAGRPVLVSTRANEEGVIEDGVTGWVVPTNDIAHLADTLHAILTMSDGQLAAMRRACTKRVQDFRVEILVQRYSALYDTLASAIAPT